MAVKIRLQRHGKKGKPFYWIVAADARSKRDGKYLEKIGTYDPNQKPAAIDLNFDSALSWLDKGAQPTNTAKAILSYTGVLLKRHLDGGVKKGAFTEAEAKKKFDAWMKDKSAKIEKKIQDAISFLTKDRTTLVIAHRLSTILNSDKIYVINDGDVVGEGKHEDLLISSNEYKNFYDKQITKN